MPILTQEKAIKEFYEKHKEQFPSLCFEEVEEICKTPFTFIKNCFKSTRLPVIMVKHIGKFIAFPGKVKGQMAKEERFFNKGIIDEEEYLRNKAFFENHIINVKKYLDKHDTETEVLDDTEGGETSD